MPRGGRRRAREEGGAVLVAVVAIGLVGGLAATKAARGAVPSGVDHAPAARWEQPAARQRLSSDVQARLAARLPARIDSIFDRLEAGFDRAAAWQLVDALDGSWRLAGNADYESAQARVLDRLLEAGFRQFPSRPSQVTEPSVWYESFANGGHGWAHSAGRLSVVNPDGRREVVLSRETDLLTVCINSFSTPPGGVLADLVDVGGARTPEAMARFDVSGRVVLGDAEAGPLWRMASARGALGVVSTALAPYVTPDPASGAGPPTPRERWGILQWGTIPYDESRRGFGFKATPRAALDLRARARRGPVRVLVDIAASFSERPNRTLVAEIPGTSRPIEHVVLMAHVQEPGANDNGSGMATLQELARTMLSNQRAGLALPGRSLTFLWGDEVNGSREWLRWAREAGREVRFMFAMDMTGHDVDLTGGSFLIERAPDPSALDDSPFDPHTEWGGGPVNPAWVRGTLLNDLLLGVCARYGARDGWVVRTNPYEGGSDHAVFIAAGVPSLLAWHYPDRYYHTNLDRSDKTSAREMERVGVAVGAAVHLLATATESDAESLVTLVEEAADDRFALERSLPNGPPSRLDAWRTWYHEAFAEIVGLPVEPSHDAKVRARLVAAVARAQRALRTR